MSNYFWTADGNYLKKSIYEHLDNFSVTEDKFCIQDTCLSKSEMILLKESVANYSIFQNVNDKDILTEREVTEYIKEIFRIIHTSSGDEQKSNINKYLCHGLKDIKLGNIFKFSDKYQELDFNELYMAAPNFKINTIDFNENDIKNIVTSNLIVDPRDFKKRFVITDDDITNIAPKYHFFVYNDFEFLLAKAKTSDYYWKIIIFWDQLINDAYVSLDNEYKEKFKTNFDSINAINFKETITKIEYLKLVDDLKIVSINAGIYDFDSFKDNIFLKQYNILLELDTITKEYFDGVIYESNKFQLSEIKDDDKITELKTRLGVEFIGKKHYILDESESYNIRLLRVKYPNKENFQWQILYLQNKSFIEYEDSVNDTTEEGGNDTTEEGFMNIYKSKNNKPVFDKFYIRFFK